VLNAKKVYESVRKYATMCKRRGNLEEDKDDEVF